MYECQILDLVDDQNDLGYKKEKSMGEFDQSDKIQQSKSFFQAKINPNFNQDSVQRYFNALNEVIYERYQERQGEVVDQIGQNPHVQNGPNLQNGPSTMQMVKMSKIPKSHPITIPPIT